MRCVGCPKNSRALKNDISRFLQPSHIALHTQINNTVPINWILESDVGLTSAATRQKGGRFVTGAWCLDDPGLVGLCCFGFGKGNRGVWLNKMAETLARHCVGQRRR
jgi:hypothetical protein